MATLNINGKDMVVDADPSTPILWALRETLGMNGTKFGCGAGLCGARTVHVDGAAVRYCTTPTSSAVGKKLPTIEAVAEDKVGLAVTSDADIDAALAGKICRCGTYARVLSAIKAAASTSWPDPTELQGVTRTGPLC